LISRPSCAGRPPEICYSHDDEKGPGYASRDLCLFGGARFRISFQVTDIK
jgi:hypothetical protein